MCSNSIVHHRWKYLVAGPWQLYRCTECARFEVRPRRLGRYFNTRLAKPKPVLVLDRSADIPAFLRHHA